MSELASDILAVFQSGNGREDVTSLWDQVDTPERNVSFDELIAAMMELQEAGKIEVVPGWETEYQLKKSA